MNNLNLVNVMTNDEKIDFVTLDMYKSKTLGAFDFPSIKFSFNFNEDNYLIFPSKEALGVSFDDETLEKVIKLKVNETKIFSPYTIFCFDIDLNKEKYSQDPYLNARYIARCSYFIHKYGGKSCLLLDDNFVLPQEHNSFIDDMYLDILKNGNIDFIIVRTLEEMKFFKEKFNFNGYFFGMTDEVNDAISLINNGALFIFYNDNELPLKLKESIIAYDKKALMVESGELSEFNFNELVSHNLIINKNQLNENLDKIIDLIKLLKDKNNNEDNQKEYLSNINTHKEILDDISKSSIVLLKNKDDILPISDNEETLFIGKFAPQFQEWAKRSSIPYTDIIKYQLFDDFNIEKFVANLGSKDIAFKVKRLNDDFKFTYTYEQELKELIDSYQKVVMYVDIKNEKKLDSESNKLISYFSKIGKKVILLVKSEYVPYIEMLDNVDACILSLDITSKGKRTLFDSLIGDINPQGHIISSNKEVLNIIPNYNIYEDEQIKFGFGLSYSKFEYSNFKLTKDGMSFDVYNNSEYDGYDVAYLFVRNDESKSIYKYKILRGYKKYFLKAHQTTNIDIEFDDLTFAYFDPLTSSYGIEGGKYKVFLSSYYSKDIFVDVIELNEVLDEKFAIKENEELVSLGNDEKVVEEKISFKGKITIISIIYLYLILSFATLLIINLVNESFSIFSIVTIALLVVSIVGYIISLLLIIHKNNKKHPELKKDDNLNALLDNTFKLNEINKIVYAKPVNVTTEKGIDIVKEEVVENKDTSNEYVLDQVDTDLTSSSVDNEKLYAYKTFDELFTSYNRYLEQNGLIVDKTSLKAFLSSIGSNKLIVLNLNDKELEKEFMFYTLKFFGNELSYIDNISFNDNYDSYNDLMVTDGKNSDLLNNLLKARNSSLMSLCPIKVDNIKRFEELLKIFVYSSITPKEEMNIVVNDVHNFSLDRSLKYVILPSEENFVELMSKNLIEASMVVNLSIRKQDYEGEKITPKTISYTNFNDLIYETKKEFYLQENSFKHFDELEVKFKENGFKIGNVNTIQIETYSSLLISLELSDNEVIDLILQSKIIPLLKHTSLYDNENASNIAIETFRAIFDEESLVKSLPYLQKIEIKEDETNKHVEEELKDEANTEVEVNNVEETNNFVESDNEGETPSKDENTSLDIKESVNEEKDETIEEVSNINEENIVSSSETSLNTEDELDKNDLKEEISKTEEIDDMLTSLLDSNTDEETVNKDEEELTKENKDK
jgi:hypothetical protein